MNEVKQNEIKTKTLSVSVIQVPHIQHIRTHTKRRGNEQNCNENCQWRQTFQQGTLDVGEGVLDPGEQL